MTRSISADLGVLLAEMPATTAAPAVRAAWFRRKAAVLRRIAAESDIPADATDAAELAVLAEAQADRVERGV